MRRSGTIRFAAGFILVLVLFGATLAQARAGGSADLVIHSRRCPTGYSGDNLFADCHDTPLPTYFTISGPESTTVDADAAGNVTFADLIPGSYNVYEPLRT
jgi:hypothetical protein